MKTAIFSLVVLLIVAVAEAQQAEGPANWYPRRGISRV